jgi:hypothetical protein
VIFTFWRICRMGKQFESKPTPAQLLSASATQKIINNNNMIFCIWISRILQLSPKSPWNWGSVALILLKLGTKTKVKLIAKLREIGLASSFQGKLDVCWPCLPRQGFFVFSMFHYRV